MSFRHLLRAAAVIGTFASLVAAAPAQAQRTTITFNNYRSTTTTEPGYQATFYAPLTANGYEFYDLYTQSSSAGPSAFSSQQVASWGTNSSDLGSKNLPSNLGSTSAALWGNGTTDRLEMNAAATADGYTPFRLYSMDMGSLFARSSITPALGGPAAMNIYFQYFKTLNAYTTGIPDGDLYAYVNVAPTVNGDVVPLLRTVNFAGTANSSDVFVKFLSGNAGDLTDGTGIYGIQWFQGSLDLSSTSTGYRNIDSWTLAQRSGLSHQFTNIVAEVVTPEPSTFALAGIGLVTVIGVGLRHRQNA